MEENPEVGASGWSPPPEDRRRPRRLVMKRKVLRHRPDGAVEVSDESTASEPEGEPDLWALRQELHQLQVDSQDSISEGELETSTSTGSTSTSSSSSDESREDSPPLLPRHWRSRSLPPSQGPFLAGQPKSFIPPCLEPRGQRRGGADPVGRYHQYREQWEKFHIPGEEPWLELRRSVRRQMLRPPDPPGRPRPRPPLLSTYVVPTQKKRSALRWGVRWALALGVPPRGSCSQPLLPQGPLGL